ncbi:hypothetical protein EDEG_00811 [Edhazardia aedis USNM 41457]|uniref:Replication factor A protein 3 n=1 Tax=Edhazardia aedis (strain USNM 41457) TaxID=1003232 RepID=J8ZZP1_EDHAE|nr:hypothetical protein EDEG_00811 [Edhazardia aedis USNM 41457]|eukprot:EJW05098.1 hypothetical protein EDEG_00811 [Edhazardia aedis USNM 41457]
MYVQKKEDLQIGEKVSIIGKVNKIDSEIAHIETPLGTIPVKFKNLHCYTNQYLCINGVVDSALCIVEDDVINLGNDFDEDLFNEFVGISKNFSELF